MINKPLILTVFIGILIAAFSSFGLMAQGEGEGDEVPGGDYEDYGENDVRMPEYIWQLDWSPDGSQIAASIASERCGLTKNDYSIRIFNAENGELVNKLAFHDCLATALQWSPDSAKLISVGSLDLQYLVWDVEQGEILFQSPYPHNSLEAVSGVWSPDGSLYATIGYFGPSIAIWDAATGENIQNVDVEDNRHRVLAWSPNGESLALGDDTGEMIVYSIANNAITAVVDGFWGKSLLWSGDWLIGVSEDSSIAIWDSESGEIEAIFSGHTDFITDIAYNENTQRLASASHDGTVRIWDVTDGSQIGIFNYSARVEAVAWSPDGSKIVYGGTSSDGQDAEIVIADVSEAIKSESE